MSVNPPRRRLSRGTLTHEQILETALSLADTQGVEALTMPALARRLGCGVMSIYGHIACKESLLQAVAERAFADLRLPQPFPDDAVEILVGWGAAVRVVLGEHTWLPAILLAQPVIGPGILRGADYLLAALDRVGYPPLKGVHAIYAVLVYSVGFLAWEVPRTRAQSEAAYAACWRRTLAMFAPGELPYAEPQIAELGTVASEVQFRLGLAALVKGLV